MKKKVWDLGGVLNGRWIFFFFCLKAPTFSPQRKSGALGQHVLLFRICQLSFGKFRSISLSEENVIVIISKACVSG